MKIFVLGLTAVAGLASAASANWGFQYQFSLDNVSFSATQTVDVSGGSKTVYFRVVAYADPGTTVNAAGQDGLAVAYARYTGSEKLTNFGSGSAGDAVLSNTNVLPQVGTTYKTSSFSGGNTILGNTAATSFTSQLLTSGALAAYCPASGGTPQLSWVIRKGSITVGQAGGTRTIAFMNNTRTTNTWYRDYLDPNTGYQDVNSAAPDGAIAPDQNGSLNVIPAPGSIALVGLGGLIVARRRRA